MWRWTRALTISPQWHLGFTSLSSLLRPHLFNEVRPGHVVNTATAPHHSWYVLSLLQSFFFHSTYLLLTKLLFIYFIVFISYCQFPCTSYPQDRILYEFYFLMHFKCPEECLAYVNIHLLVVEWKHYCFSQSPIIFFTTSWRIFWNYWELIKMATSPMNAPGVKAMKGFGEWVDAMHPYSSLISLPWDWCSTFSFVVEYIHGMMQRIYHLGNMLRKFHQTFARISKAYNSLQHITQFNH